MNVETQLAIGLAEARVVFEAGVASGRSERAAFLSALQAFEAHLDDSVIVEDVEDLLAEMLEIDASESVH
jgi:hypothetical protein